MQASQEDLELLLDVQQIDLDLMRLAKQFDELPQRQTIADARSKREAILKKHTQVDALKKDASKRLTRINDEDESLAKKENGVQAAIEAAAGDFRHAEARSKELEGISKRRKKLSEERAGIDQELEKIGQLNAQLAKAVEDLNKLEANATETFQKEGSALKAKLAALESKREDVLSSIDAEVVTLYRKTADRSGSVAIGVLQDNKCGVCRSSIDGGRLIDLRAQAPLGVCPSCHRLLIIKQ